MPSPLLRPLTPATEAYQQEQQAMAPVNQQAAEMDTIAQAQASEQAFAKQVQGQAAEAERAQRKQIAEQKAQESRQKEMLANAKRAGVKTTFDGGGQEQPVLHPDGQPVFEHGFQGDVQPGDNGHTVDYRDPRGRVYKVPTKAIRSSQDPAGNPLYEFNIKKEDGTTDTIRQPVGSKPLWNTDPKTGDMYTGAPDPETGSYGQTKIGVDTTVAGKAALTRQKELFDQQQSERKFQSDSLMLDQNVRETNLAPVKKQLSEAQAAAKKIAKAKVQYKETPEGYVPMQDFGNGLVDGAPIPSTDPASIVKAKAWLEQKAATDKALADAKASHDPLAAEVQTMQQKRDQLAIEALNHSRSAQVQMMQMEKAQKAGLPVHEPDWQKRIAAARTDPRITSIFSQAELDQMGGPLAEDAKRVSLPETTKLMQRAFTPDFNLDGTLTEDPTAAPAVPMQRPEASLANHIGERLTADNVPVKGTDVKALTTQALGITEPEKWQVTPSQGISGELGYHTLTHNGEDIGEFSTRENRFVLNPPSSSDMDRQQQRLINTSSDGLPVYFASDTPPLPKSAVSDMIRQGVDISRSSTDRVAVESKLAEAKLSPADLRQKVMNGELSVQDGRLLNETFHGIKDLDASKPAIEAAFGQHLTSPVLGPLFKKGDLTTRQGIVNQFMDAYAERAGNNIIAPSRSDLAKYRDDLLTKTDPRGMVGKGVDFVTDLPRNAIAPMAGMAVQLLTSPYYLARKGLGYKDAEADIIRNGGRDLIQRLVNDSNPVHRMFGDGEMNQLLQGDLRAASDKIQSVDELPDDLAHKIRDAAFDGYHRFTDENARDVNTTRDSYDIKKDPTLRAMFDRYLQTADGSTFDGMLQMLSMTVNDRATQKQTMEYLERPRTATADNVIDRAKLLDMNLDAGRAAQVLAIGKQLDSVKDEKQYKNVITQAGKVLGLEKPADIQLALSHLTHEETDKPDSWRYSFNSGRVANPAEILTEVGSDLLGAALTASIIGAPEAVALKAAQVGARQALKRAFMAPVTALRSGVSKIAKASMDSLAEKSARFAAARTMLQKIPAKYQALGIVEPKLGASLTTLQKARNLGVGLAKSAVAVAPIEAAEEGLMAALDAAPTPGNLVDSMIQGALGGTVLVPMFAGAQSLNRAWQSGKRTQSITDYKTGLVDKFNTRMAGQAGFTPLTVADFDIMQGIQDNPAHQSALQDHAAALEELGAATQEHTQNVMDYQDAADGNAVPAIPESPRLLAAQANAQRTAANVEGLSSIAFSAMDELRALPDDQRPLYTGIAKAVSGATDYTEAEGKALIGLGGQSAVAFQQAQSLPADVAGPANVTQLPSAPTVQQTGLGSYRLPAGVRIQVPPQAIAALQERAPSLAGLIGGQMPAPKQSVTTPTATTQNIPQQNAGQQTAAPLPRNPALAGVSDEALAQRHALAVELSNRPGQADAATYAQDAAVMAQEIEARKTPNPASFIPESEGGTGKPLPPKAIYDDKTPVTEQEVRAVVDAVVAEEIYARNNRAGRALIVTQPYQANDGGALFHIESNTVVIDPSRLAASIWADRSSKPTREEVAKAAALVVDHEVVHAAQIQAARDTYDKANPNAKAKDNHKAFMAWVADHYGQMWKYDFPDDIKSAVIETYGKVLEGKPEWQKAFEALRMIVQERSMKGASEAATFLRIREHLEAVLAVIKKWYSGVMQGSEKHAAVKAEIEAIESLLAKKSPQTTENGAKTPKSSTQLTLSAKDAAPILAFGESIPKDELYDSLDPEWSDGALETEPHVTVLFGLTKHEADPVAAAIADHGPVTVTLGKMSIFENDEFDVLKIDVESPELRALNAKLSKLPNENSYPDYKPHMTIAYLKKGEGKKYVGDSRFAGKKITFDTMTFSPPSELRPELGKPELPLTKATPSLSVQIPLGKGGAKLDATFPDAESLAAFQFQDIIDAATKGKTPEERDAARQRGVSMLAAMMEDTRLSEPELRKKLQGYRESVIEQANAANPLQVFKPTPFHAYAKTDELAQKSLPPPAGGDIISGMQGQGIRRIGPPTNSADWSWYRELEADADGSKMKPGEAQRLARAGDVTDAKARLAWINANVVSTKSGRSIDEAATELNASADQAFPVESGDQLGRAIVEALDARAKAKQGGATPEAAQEQQAKDAAASFDTLKKGAVGQPFTASQLSRSLENGDEIKIGGEIFTVVDVSRDDEYVRMESDRFGPVEITGEDKVNLNEGPDHLRIGKAPPVTHTMPDGYVLTEEGMNAIGSAPTRAYHGTPHKVDKFSMSKVGTGEGAQAYGFGLYFAGNKSVAQQYQKGLTERDFIRKVQQEFSEGDNQEDALDAIRHLDLSEGQRALIDVLAKEDWWGFDYPHQAVQAAIREPQNFDPSPEVLDALDKFGQLYTVDLLPDEEEFLDWDKPLSEQSEKVRAMLQNNSLLPRLEIKPGTNGNFDLFEDGLRYASYDSLDRAEQGKKRRMDVATSGEGIYFTLSSTLGTGGRDRKGAQQSSNALAKAGIPGIRYLDGGSRFKMQQTSHAWEVLNGAGKLVAKEPTEAAARAAMEKLQTRNYVLFDENLVRIIAENGKPVDSLASAPSRSRPRQTIVFNTPIQTPIGAINSYSWASKLEEVTDKSGEIVERRMSDWDKAVTNAETGRDIVHQFEVTQPDGSSKTVSLETVLGKLSEGAKKDTIAILRAARRLPIREAELQALNARREDYLKKLEYAQSEGWKSAPEPRLETPDFPPLAESGAKSVYVGTSWINNLEANEIGQISDPQRIRQFKQQWATDQIRGLALNGTEQDKIASLQRGIRKDRELLKSNAVNAPVESLSSAPSPGGLSEADATVKMYRSGSSFVNDAGFLFLSSNPDYAALFDKNKGVDAYDVRPGRILDMTQWDGDTDVSHTDFIKFLTDNGIETTGLSKTSGEPLQQLSQRNDKKGLLAKAIQDAGFDSVKLNEYVEGEGRDTTLALLDDDRAEFASDEGPESSSDAGGTVNSAPSRYQSPASMLAATQAQMQGAEGEKPAGLNSMFNPKPRIPATGERTLFQMPNKPAPAIAPRSIIDAYRSAAVGQSSAMIPIRSVFEKARESQPNLTVEDFLSALDSMDDGRALFGLTETTAAYNAAKPFVHGPAGVEMAFSPELVKASTILSNLDRVKAVRPLLPDEQAAYDKATADIAAQETLGSAPSVAKKLTEWANQDVDDSVRSIRFENPNTGEMESFGDLEAEIKRGITEQQAIDTVRWLQSVQSQSQDFHDVLSDVLWMTGLSTPNQSLGSAPTESAPAQATPDNEAQVREIIASMPQVWQDVLKDFNAGKSVENIAKARLYTPEQTAHILSLAQGRFDYLRGALPTKPKVAPVAGGEPLFKGGSPGLAYSSIPAFAAVDQNRGTPEQVTHAEMQEAATRMFAIDPAAAEKLVTRWMDGGGMAFSVEDMPDGIKAIVADAQSRKSSMALMTAAAQIFTVENAFAGGSSAKSARLIDLYRNSGEEISRALSQRRDVFETPAERNAWFLSEVLLTPPPSIRGEMKRNPANKAKILAEWATRADQIKKELLAEGIDIDATMKQMAKERELAAATIPAAIKPALAQAPKSVRQAVKTILEGGSWQDAINASGLGHKAAQKAYNAFRGLRNIGSKIAAGIRETLGSAPSETFTELPEWTDDVNLKSAPINTPQTKALAIHRNRKMEGEIDLKNDLSVNKTRQAMALRKASGFDKLMEYWKSSILSGPLTAIVNVSSGLGFGAYKVLFKKLSASVQADIVRLFGFQPDAPSLRDFPAMLSAVIPSLQSAGTDMLRSWNNETQFFDRFATDDGLFAGTSSDGEQFDPAIKGIFGKVMRGISFRHMTAADEFVKSFLTRIEVGAQALQIARNEGKTGEALATAMKDLMRPGSLAWERALSGSKVATFQSQEVRGNKLDSDIGSGERAIDVLDNLARILGKAKKGDFGSTVKVASHFLFPFVGTPTNIFKTGITMSPAGGLLALIDASRAVARSRKGNHQEAAKIYNAARAFDDITNQIVCWGVMLGIASLVKPGDDDEPPMITGSTEGDASSGERELTYRAAPPYSIRLWGKWYSYKRLDPLGTALAFCVDSVREFQKGKPIDKVWAKIGTGMLATMQDKTFMKSISDISNVLHDPERYGTRWIAGIATGFVPNLIRQPARATDHVFRETDFPNDMPFAESFARRIGFGMYPSPNNPLAPLPAVDAFGRESAKNTGTGQPGTDIMLRLISPLESLDATNVDPLDKKFLRYNMTHDKGFSFTAPPREITRTIGGKEIKISLSDEEYLPYEKSSGQAFHGAMNTIYGSKTADYSEQDHDDIVHLRTKVIKPFTDDAFSKALRKRQAAGTLKP